MRVQSLGWVEVEMVPRRETGFQFIDSRRALMVLGPERREMVGQWVDCSRRFHSLSAVVDCSVEGCCFLERAESVGQSSVVKGRSNSLPELGSLSSELSLCTHPRIAKTRVPSTEM
jgi:hypothetical protein